MAELRAFVDRLRERSGVPCPLAHCRPFVAGRELVREAQDDAGLDPEYCLVAEVRGQLVLTPASQAFFDRVTWTDDVAAAWRPHGEERSPARIDPDVRLGRPAVKGISTEVIWEHVESGEHPAETGEAFGLELLDVRWALAYETSLRAA